MIMITHQAHPAGVDRVGRGGPGGWDGAGGDVLCWMVLWLTIFEPNGLCWFGVKNAREVVSRW
jgi:hypothetical protein